MSRRHIETITDLLIVAISPALVIFMVGSLVFFATHCFYDGAFHTRLRISAGLFVIAAVLVSRISIDEGREYASMFAIPLSIATVLSIMKYTDAGMIVIPLVAFIWWSTNKLTWDCTVLDDRKDASGEGLLQTIGREGDAEAEEGSFLDQEATTDSVRSESKSLWERWRAHRRRHHTPGVWVIYFGLAAIPLFGLGQLLIPVQSRGAGFLLLCIYVASALALLLTTSFLQMRRYLIQRRLPFTDQMASVWLGTGGTLIIGLMLLCLLLPRPNTGFSFVDSFDKVSSREQRASRVSTGRDGVVDNERSGRGESSEKAESDSEEGTQPSEDAEQGSRPGENPKTKGGEQSDAGQPDEGQGETNTGGDGESERSENDEAESSNGESKEQNGEGNRESSEPPRENENAEPELDGRDRDASQGTRAEPQPLSVPRLLPNLTVPSIPKLVYFAIIAVLVLFVFLRYGREIGAALQAFLRDFAAMFGRLLGGRRRSGKTIDSGEEKQMDVEPQRAFSSFQDPFAAGTADRFTPQQLVNYSFEALQAWAAERDCGRTNEQTPLEFAGSISGSDKRVGLLARNLAVFYNQAAYAPDAIGADAVDHARALWRVLRGRGT